MKIHFIKKTFLLSLFICQPHAEGQVVSSDSSVSMMPESQTNVRPIAASSTLNNESSTPSTPAYAPPRQPPLSSGSAIVEFIQENLSVLSLEASPLRSNVLERIQMSVQNIHPDDSQNMMTALSQYIEAIRSLNEAENAYQEISSRFTDSPLVAIDVVERATENYFRVLGTLDQQQPSSEPTSEERYARTNMQRTIPHDFHEGHPRSIPKTLETTIHGDSDNGQNFPDIRIQLNPFFAARSEAYAASVTELHGLEDTERNHRELTARLNEARQRYDDTHDLRDRSFKKLQRLLDPQKSTE